MDVSKVQFVRKEDLHRRLTQFTPPKDECYIFHRLEGRDFFRCGISFSYEIRGERIDCDYKLFDIYAGNRDLFLYIRDMIQEVAESEDRTLTADDWPEDDS